MNNKTIRLQQHVNDTLLHKQLLINSCLKMANYLFEHEREEEGLELAKRCSMHDHSKLSKKEIENFIQLPVESHVNKPHGILTPEQRKLIEDHWASNRHHPEFFTHYSEMSEMDIIEMCCDWHARSKQFNTDFLEYVNTRQKQRFNFDDDFFNRVLFYCEILAK